MLPFSIYCCLLDLLACLLDAIEFQFNNSHEGNCSYVCAADQRKNDKNVEIGRKAAFKCSPPSAMAIKLCIYCHCKCKSKSAPSTYPLSADDDVICIFVWTMESNEITVHSSLHRTFITILNIITVASSS